MDSLTTGRVDWKRVIIYCAFAFGLAYAIALVVWLNGGLSESPLLAPGISLAWVLLIIYMFTPAAAHVLTRLLTREGWHNIGLRSKFKKVWLYWLVAWLVTPLLIGLGMLIYFLLFPQHFDPEMNALAGAIAASGVDPAQLPMPMAVLLLAQTLQAVLISPLLNSLPVLGEEFGWRAYLQPKLMPLGPRKALLLTGAIWGLWHAPIIAMGYNYGNYDLHYFGAPWTGILMMTCAAMWMGVFFGWLSYKAQSVWPAVIGHGSLNGTAGVALLMAQGTPLMLLGPSVVGLIGGVGFIAAALLILIIPNAFRLAAVSLTDESEVPISAVNLPDGE